MTIDIYELQDRLIELADSEDDFSDRAYRLINYINLKGIKAYDYKFVRSYNRLMKDAGYSHRITL